MVAAAAFMAVVAAFMAAVAGTADTAESSLIWLNGICRIAGQIPFLAFKKNHHVTLFYHSRPQNGRKSRCRADDF
jgi:hypothetical protein